LFFLSDTQVKLIDLPIASQIKTTMDKVFEMQFQILDYLENINDYTVANAKNKMVDFGNNIEAMVKSEAILLDSEMQEKFQLMKHRMVPIYDKLNNNDKIIFANKMNMK